MKKEKEVEKNHKPKMVIATDNFLPRYDGITRFLSEVIPRLKNEFEITVICPEYKEEKVSMPGVKIIRIPLSKKKVGDFKIAKWAPRKIIKALKGQDVVFTQTIGTIGASALFFAQRMKIKTIPFIHSIEWELVAKSSRLLFVKKYSYPITKRITHFLYSRCTQLIVPSENVADILTWKDLKTPKKIINLGVDTNKFIPGNQEDKIKLKEQLGISENQLIIGYHGRIAREKDIPTLMRAFIKLRVKHPNIKLLIVGSGIKSIERKLERQPGVIHVQGVNNVEKYLQIMDIYCLTSLTETTSLSVLEAMSSGLPVVTSRVGFIKDYIAHNKNGMFFKQGSSFSLVIEIEKLINSEKLRKKLGENARHTVVHSFDWDLTGMRLISFFLEMFNKENNS